MEAQGLVPLLLELGLSVLVLLAIFLGRTSTNRRSRPLVPSPQATTVVISDPALVRLMLIDNADAFSDRPMLPFPEDFCGTHSITSVPYGSTWRALRANLIANIFHPTRLSLLMPLQQEAIEALVADLSTLSGTTGEEVVVRNSLHTAVFDMVVHLCLGDRIEEHEVRVLERDIQQFVFSMVEDSSLAGSRLARILHWRRWRRYSGIFSRLSKLILPIIAARQRSRQNETSSGSIRCYVDSLLDLSVPNNDADATTKGGKRPLTDREMVRLVFEFLGANTESVVSCVEWTLACLVIHPEVQEKLHHEITNGCRSGNKGRVLVCEDRLRGLPYLRAVILESLRLHPPLSLMMRQVDAHGMEVCGVPAPADGTPMELSINVGDIGRNGKVWTDPDEFRPDRFLAGGEAEGMGPVPGPKKIALLPFGAGRRHCAGVEVAMAHVGYFLAALVHGFEWAPPMHGRSIDLTENPGFFTVMKTPLKARITPRVLSTRSSAGSTA